MKSTRLILAATLAVAWSAASAQGYWSGPGGAVWKNAAGQCWRAGYWTPAMASAECDPDLVPKPAPKPAPKPEPAPAPKPEPKPEPKPAPKPEPKPEVKPEPKPKPAVLRSTVLFASGKATLDEMAKFRLDMDIVNRLKGVGTINFVLVNGHTDRLESPKDSQKVSERRAEAVKAYLVAKGIDAARIEAYGYGKTAPAASCPDTKDRKALARCLEPNRRVEVELQAAPR